MLTANRWLNVGEIYARAAEAAQQAAAEISAVRHGAADTAQAAADLLTAGADATSTHEL